MSATFWWMLTIICLVWYAAVTSYVSVRGGLDIKHMLARLERLQDEESEDEASH